MRLPDFQSLMLPVLSLLSQHRRSTSEIVDSLADQLNLTTDERTTLLPAGRQTIIANRTHWALAHLNRAGLVHRISQGHYELTPTGLELLNNPPLQVSIAFLQKYPDYANSRSTTNRDQASSGDDTSVAAPSPSLQRLTPEEQIEAADKSLRSELVSALVARLQLLRPEVFEQLIIDVLVGIGYGGTRRDAASRLGRSGDGGIDGVIREDTLGLDTIYLQAKRYADDNPVGAPAIQGFAGALLSNGATKGVFVTTGRYTPQAKQVANSYKAHRVILIDGQELARLMIDHEVGVRTVQVIRIQRLALETYENSEI